MPRAPKPHHHLVHWSLIIGHCSFLLLLLSACNSDSSTPPPNDNLITPIHSFGTFKQVQPELYRGIATINGTDMVVYWDDQTTFFRNGQPSRMVTKYWQNADNPSAPPRRTTNPADLQYVREQQITQDIDVPKTGETFEFRGFLNRQKIGLTIVIFQ